MSVVLLVSVLAALAGPIAAGEWMPGDTHNHIHPPDKLPAETRDRCTLGGAISSAREAGLKWLIITPHDMDRKNPKTGRLWCEDLNDQLAKLEVKDADLLVVLGWERQSATLGDMTISFVDLKKLVGKSHLEMLKEVSRQGGIANVAHPFFTMPFGSEVNKYWRPWKDGGAGHELDPWIVGLEIRHPVSPAVLATKRWDEWIAAEQRRIIGVGATDDHWGVLYATTWVYIDGELTREKLRDALKGGRIVVGESASAGSLAVQSDRTGEDGKPLTGRPGDAVAADEQVTVTWEESKESKGSKGRLFVDGKLQKVDGQRMVHKFAKGGFHWYRLEMGIRSYSNPVYVNLPPDKAPPSIKPAGSGAEAPEAQCDKESEQERPSVQPAGPAAKPADK